MTKETGMKSTLRVAGGWVRDKILASREFNVYTNGSMRELSLEGSGGGGGRKKVECDEMDQGEMKRITSKFKGEKDENNDLCGCGCVCVFLFVDAIRFCCAGL